MWKIALAFAIFAALALYMLSKGGVDISGEKHGIELPSATEPAATDPAPAAAASVPASAASN